MSDCCNIPYNRGLLAPKQAAPEKKVAPPKPPKPPIVIKDAAFSFNKATNNGKSSKGSFWREDPNPSTVGSGLHDSGADAFQIQFYDSAAEVNSYRGWSTANYAYHSDSPNYGTGDNVFTVGNPQFFLDFHDIRNLLDTTDLSDYIKYEADYPWYRLSYIFPGDTYSDYAIKINSNLEIIEFWEPLYGPLSWKNASSAITEKKLPTLQDSALDFKISLPEPGRVRVGLVNTNAENPGRMVPWNVTFYLPDHLGEETIQIFVDDSEQAEAVTAISGDQFRFLHNYSTNTISYQKMDASGDYVTFAVSDFFTHGEDLYVDMASTASQGGVVGCRFVYGFSFEFSSTNLVNNFNGASGGGTGEVNAGSFQTLQDAVDALTEKSPILMVPGGVHVLTSEVGVSPLVINKPFPVTIRGVGTSVLKHDNLIAQSDGSGEPMIVVLSDVFIQDLVLDGDASTNSGAWPNKFNNVYRKALIHKNSADAPVLGRVHTSAPSLSLSRVTFQNFFIGVSGFGNLITTSCKFIGVERDADHTTGVINTGIIIQPFSKTGHIQHQTVHITDCIFSERLDLSPPSTATLRVGLSPAAIWLTSTGEQTADTGVEDEFAITEFRRVTISRNRFIGFCHPIDTYNGIQEASITDNHFSHFAYAGIKAQRCERLLISGNTFKYGIAPITSAAGGNFCAAIAVNGEARSYSSTGLGSSDNSGVTISNNIIRAVEHFGIFCQEAQTSITGNVIDGVMNQPNYDTSAISIYVSNPRRTDSEDSGTWSRQVHSTISNNVVVNMTSEHDHGNATGNYWGIKVEAGSATISSNILTFDSNLNNMSRGSFGAITAGDSTFSSADLDTVGVIVTGNQISFFSDASHNRQAWYGTYLFGLDEPIVSSNRVDLLVSGQLEAVDPWSTFGNFAHTFVKCQGGVLSSNSLGHNAPMIPGFNPPRYLGVTALTESGGAGVLKEELNSFSLTARYGPGSKTLQARINTSLQTAESILSGAWHSMPRVSRVSRVSIIQTDPDLFTVSNGTGFTRLFDLTSEQLIARASVRGSGTSNGVAYKLVEIEGLAPITIQTVEGGEVGEKVLFQKGNDHTKIRTNEGSTDDATYLTVNGEQWWVLSPKIIFKEGGTSGAGPSSGALNLPPQVSSLELFDSSELIELIWSGHYWNVATNATSQNWVSPRSKTENVFAVDLAEHTNFTDSLATGVFPTAFADVDGDGLAEAMNNWSLEGVGPVGHIYIQPRLGAVEQINVLPGRDQGYKQGDRLIVEKSGRTGVVHFQPSSRSLQSQSGGVPLGTENIFFADGKNLTPQIPQLLASGQSVEFVYYAHTNSWNCIGVSVEGICEGSKKSVRDLSLIGQSINEDNVIVPPGDASATGYYNTIPAGSEWVQFTYPTGAISVAYTILGGQLTELSLQDGGSNYYEVPVVQLRTSLVTDAITNFAVTAVTINTTGQVSTLTYPNLPTASPKSDGSYVAVAGVMLLNGEWGQINQDIHIYPMKTVNTITPRRFMGDKVTIQGCDYTLINLVNNVDASKPSGRLTIPPYPDLMKPHWDSSTDSGKVQFWNSKQLATFIWDAGEQSWYFQSKNFHTTTHDEESHFE
jgi:hypothetical protein